MADEPKQSVLVEHWPTIAWRSAVGYAAALAYFAPDGVQWALAHLDSIPPALLSDETKAVARPVLVIAGVIIARIVRQNKLREKLAEKSTTKESP